ncbi:MAG: adenylyltransferase/cytidyltransferase family protein [Kiritimatiellae bacterium]|nr:adenylyltransferase/cytidyltransferase family protein [Kiritimatiellia bacterium]MDD5521661.1 adenylyltransferase/cytidyltransferase family protein [Kiritimatiellia bacterium]
MKKVFVSGCYDILHGGHVEFFNQAKALGDYLIVCIASEEVQFIHKRRRPFLPIEHKINLVKALKMVDEVVVGDDMEMGLNFKTAFLKASPQVLAVTDDDKFEGVKKALCAQIGAEYVKLPKVLGYKQISSTELFQRMTAPAEVPMRVDFAGGWLDVPRFSRPGSYVVNCAISPLVSLYHWPYETCSGLGGSGAHAHLMAKDAIKSELANNVGWQDPVIIHETGLCVWHSGKKPVLEFKVNPSFLREKMAIYWTGKQHVTMELANTPRDYDLLVKGSLVGREAAIEKNFNKLCEAVSITHEVQLKEGMQPLPNFGEKAKKYCGGGHGGYAVYLFDEIQYNNQLLEIQPYMKSFADSLD